MASLDKNPLTEETRQEAADGVELRPVPGWKRALDVACVVIAAPLWLPLSIAIGVGIKVVSPGPILFRQERVGHMGRRFNILKFRSMKVDADTGVHKDHLKELMTGNQTLKKLDAGDKRLIPGGLLLRTVGLDELPQLINVLRGDMSLVGPRPSLGYEYEMYDRTQRQRCHTLPGLTGLWQVKGKNRTTFARMIELDLDYVKRKSVGLDLMILASTIPAILMQAYDVRQSRRALKKAAQSETKRESHGRTENAGAKIHPPSASTAATRLVATTRAGL
jgi:exopolysaccharide production protein ExoY